ncbi:MAG: D-alanyl-D-alanine carboxypeptidase [Defluviitaleaceae bacterium]|nr:D-alanyl-D-alanine carboxypeptidase [Defluviitaleaceae bacterium]
MRRVFAILVSVLMIMSTMVVNAAPLPIDSPAFVLMEESTGRVLYARNEHERMYPASMSKMLTALVVMEYLHLDDIIIVGPEIRNMPAGFAIGLHVEGEAITVRMLLKALIIRSSNEAGRILAVNVIRQQEGNQNIQYDDTTKRAFSALLMAQARSIDANNSNFNNPYGLHSEQHFSTPYDMALITRAFMQNEALATMAGMQIFEGDGLEGRFHPDGQGRHYSLVNTNLMLPGNIHGHPYIMGARTGFTNAAGHCFAAVAYHNGLSLVSVVMGGNDIERWQDTRQLIDFGFHNFSFREIMYDEQLLSTVPIENPRLGDAYMLDIISSTGHTSLLSHWEHEHVTSTITFDSLLLVEDAPYPTLRAPIEDGAVVGSIAYFAEGNLLFEAPVLAGRAVYERTFDSDMDYHLARVFGNIFTSQALPYWFGFIGIAFGIFGLTVAVKVSRRARNYNRYAPEKRRKSRYDNRS